MDHSFDFVDDTVSRPKESGPIDFLKAIGHETVQNAIDGTTQIYNRMRDTNVVGPQLFEKPEDSGWSNTGQIVGSAIEFGLLALATRKATPFGKEARWSTPIMRSGTAGALFEGLRPMDVTDGSNFALEKAKTMAVGFGTFATMSGASDIIDRSTILGRVGFRSLVQSAGAEAIAGGFGGFANAELNAFRTKGTGASAPEVWEQTKHYAQFGAVLGGFKHFDQTRPNLLEFSQDRTVPIKTTEEFVASNVSSATMLKPRSVLNYIAETNPKLRPQGFDPQLRYPEHRTLTLSDWDAKDRPMIVGELRRIAGSNLATDQNLDVFLTRLSQTNWAKETAKLRETQVNSGTAEAQTEQIKPSVDRAQLETWTKEIEGTLNEVAMERRLGLLNVSVREQFNGYQSGQMRLGQATLEQGMAGGSGPVIGHEFLHHEQGSPTVGVDIRNQLFLMLGKDPPGYADAAIRIGARQTEIANAIKSMDEPGGTASVAARLQPGENLFKTVDGNRMPAEIRTLVSHLVQQPEGAAIPANVSAPLQSWLQTKEFDTSQQFKMASRRYFFSKIERSAYALHTLADLRSEVLGFSP